jgi:hypothetical protein
MIWYFMAYYKDSFDPAKKWKAKNMF